MWLLNGLGKTMSDVRGIRSLCCDKQPCLFDAHVFQEEHGGTLSFRDGSVLRQQEFGFGSTWLWGEQLSLHALDSTTLQVARNRASCSLASVGGTTCVGEKCGFSSRATRDTLAIFFQTVVGSWWQRDQEACFNLGGTWGRGIESWYAGLNMAR